MQRSGNLGIVSQPVGQGFDAGLERAKLIMLRRQHRRPAGKAAGKFFGTGQFGAGVGQVGCGTAQAFQQPAFGPFGQQGRINPQHTADVVDQLTADSAAVMFDQIQIRGRYPRSTRQIGLPHPLIHAPIPDPGAGKLTLGHSDSANDSSWFLHLQEN